MANIGIAQLKENIDDQISHNEGQEITGTDLNGILTDMVDTLDNGGNIIDGSITTGKIANGAVETAKIANLAVTEGKIATSAVTSGKIANGAVGSTKLADDAVIVAKIANNAVETAKIKDLNVTTAKIAQGAVTTEKIAQEAITLEKMADGAVNENVLADEAVATHNIVDGAVTTAKVNDSAITTAKINDSAVTTAKITDANVTTAKIADSNVTAAKIAANAVETAKIKDGNVTTAKLDDEAVTTAKIADEAITTAKVADGAITTGKVADGAITDDKLANPISVSQDAEAGTTTITVGEDSYDVATEPVSVSQNSQTGKTELLIGGNPALIVDNEPEVDSDNLVKSGGVTNTINTFNQTLHYSLYGDISPRRYLTNNGGIATTTRDNVAVSSYIRLNGNDIKVTKVYYSQYGPVIAFYDINKRFTHYWNPSDEIYDTIIPITVPASVIETNDYYVRATIADNGMFVSGFDNLQNASLKASDALLPSLITLSGKDRIRSKYIKLSGDEATTTLNDASASPFIILDGNDIKISQIYYAQGFSCGIAFYNKDKIFTHQYTPDNLINNAINKDVIIPNSVIQDGDVYARTTLWGNGTILSGFKTLAQKAEEDAQKAEEDAQKALEPDLLALFGEDKKVGYYIGQNGEEQYSGRTDISISPYYPLNGEELAFSLIIYSQYGKAVSFYNEDKIFISGWNPSGEYGKMAIAVPVADIPSDAVYARVTLADNGVITGGFLTLAQKAENDAQKALEQEISY